MTGSRSKHVVIWGTSGHAAVVVDLLIARGWTIAGFLDDRPVDERGTEFRGHQVLGGADQLGSLRSSGLRRALLAFGSCSGRLRCHQVLREAGFEIPFVAHPSAIVSSSALLAPGTVVCAQAVVNPQAELGESVIVNTGAIVEHHCRVGDGAHVAPGAILAGWSRLGTGSWLGVGARVIDRVTVGDRTLVGAGSVVTRDLPPSCVAYGTPARSRRVLSTHDF